MSTSEMSENPTVKLSTQAEQFRKKFRRSGSIGIPFVPDEEIPKIKNYWTDNTKKATIAEGVEVPAIGKQILTLIVRPFKKLDTLAEIMTRIKNPVRIKHIESRRSAAGDENEMFLQLELGEGLQPQTIVDGMQMAGMTVVEMACNIPAEVASNGDAQVFDAGAGEAVSGAPWFPARMADLDICSQHVLMYGSELDAEHPGFKDPVYRERRMMFAGIAMRYRHDEPVPRVEYTTQENETWGVIYRQLRALHTKHACEEYLANFEQLEKYGGYSADRVPQLDDVNKFLKAKTGFRVRPVAGYLTSRDFLAALAFRVFYCTQYIRHGTDPMYSPEPCVASIVERMCRDCVHELMGHVPLLADPDFAQFTQEIGLASLGASDEEGNKLATLYFFTIEFGLCKKNVDDEYKVYGAGLLSSGAELKHAIENEPTVRQFDPDLVVKQEMLVTTFQSSYWYTETFEEMQQKLRTFVGQMKRPFQLRYNPYTECIEVLNNKRSLTIAVNSLRSDVNLLAAALHQIL